MDVLPQKSLHTVVPAVFGFKTKNVQVTHAWSGCVALHRTETRLLGIGLLLGGSTSGFVVRTRGLVWLGHLGLRGRLYS
ncbi:uncharacterized protein BJX67DRAFT_358677 [Aspergillus lucknowensis]|uniref:Uncharacterized protein n=1 Tax=Aspergillus lucknowensis TaxID=176173 RepID=A0ABR4LPP2_9EURO